MVLRSSRRFGSGTSEKGVCKNRAPWVGIDRVIDHARQLSKALRLASQKSGVSRSSEGRYSRVTAPE